MAHVMKRRSLVNPGRRKRNPSRKRKMSPKQIKYFGTARQRAALRVSNGRRRKRNYGTKLGRSWSSATSAGAREGARIRAFRASKRAEGISYKRTKRGRKRVHNSGKASIRRAKKQGRYVRGKKGQAKFVGSYKRRKPRKNVGQIFSIGLAGLNPGKRKRTTKRRVTKMARRRRTRRSNAGRRVRRVVVRRRRSRRSNPGSYRRRRRMSNRSYHRRRRNPGIGGALGSTTGMFKNAISVIGGAVASRYATQLALGANNTGAVGYLANAVAALALGWAAGKFTKNSQVGAMVTLGGITGLALRMLNDLTPIGQYVNLSLAGAGKAGDTGIGLITDSTFFVPTVFNSGSMNQAMIPSAVSSLVAAGSVGRGTSGIGSMRRRRVA